MMRLKIETSDPFGILSSTKRVLENAKDVFLDDSNLNKLSKIIRERMKEGLDESDYGLGLSGNYKDDIQLMLVQDAVNFCFWAGKNSEKWSVEWPKGKISSGGWYGLLAVFERTRAENVPILDAKFLAELQNEDIEKLFRSATSSEIPLLHERLNNLVEVGTVLLRKYDGHFINFLEKTNYDALEIVKQLVSDFPSFRDVAEFDSESVLFLKRAQILANDLSFIFTKGKRLKIKNLDKLTAFADYKIPQMLRHFGVVKYSNSLSERIDNYKLIPAFSSQEIEIRSATIWGIELIKQELKKYSANEIDNVLWLVSQDQSEINKPYHTTYTIFY